MAYHEQSETDYTLLQDLSIFSLGLLSLQRQMCTVYTDQINVFEAVSKPKVTKIRYPLVNLMKSMTPSECAQ